MSETLPTDNGAAAPEVSSSAAGSLPVLNVSDAPKPLVTGPITIDPTDPEWLNILSFTCLDCGPMAHKLQAAGYPIDRKAEAEQAHVLMWMLSLYRDHGELWRVRGAQFLNALRDANTQLSGP